MAKDLSLAFQWYSKITLLLLCSGAGQAWHQRRQGVVTTPLTVGYFDGKDGLTQDKRLLKVVSYLDVGDGNYWAHPIENLVAIVVLESKLPTGLK